RPRDRAIFCTTALGIACAGVRRIRLTSVSVSIQHADRAVGVPGTGPGARMRREGRAGRVARGGQELAEYWTVLLNCVDSGIGESQPAAHLGRVRGCGQ